MKQLLTTTEWPPVFLFFGDRVTKQDKKWHTHTHNNDAQMWELPHKVYYFFFHIHFFYNPFLEAQVWMKLYRKSKVDGSLIFGFVFQVIFFTDWDPMGWKLPLSSHHHFGRICDWTRPSKSSPTKAKYHDPKNISFIIPRDPGSPCQIGGV